jgi:hypothetical protein
MQNLAQDAFDAHTAWSKAEDRIGDLLADIYGDRDDGFEFRLDQYDGSIEVYGCVPVEDLSRFGGAGFARVWQHPHPRTGTATHACECKSGVCGGAGSDRP